MVAREVTDWLTASGNREAFKLSRSFEQNDPLRHPVVIMPPFPSLVNLKTECDSHSGRTSLPYSSDEFRPLFTQPQDPCQIHPKLYFVFGTKNPGISMTGMA
jgi:hypothetical protein